MVELTPQTPPQSAEGMATTTRDAGASSSRIFLPQLKIQTELGKRPPEVVARDVLDVLRTHCNCTLIPDNDELSYSFLPNQTPFEDRILELFVTVDGNVRLPSPETTETERRSIDDEIARRVSRFASQWCTQSAFGLHEQIRLTFPERRAWFDACRAQHGANFVACSSVSLGDMSNFGVFSEAYRFPRQDALVLAEALRADPHYLDREVDPCTGKPIPRMGLPTIAAPSHLCTIMPNFEHDMKSFELEAIFRTLGGELRGYRFVIHYKSIHHIVADFGGVSEPGCANVCFVLKYPPQIKEGEEKKEKPQARGRGGRNARGRVQRNPSTSDDEGEESVPIARGGIPFFWQYKRVLNFCSHKMRDIEPQIDDAEFTAEELGNSSALKMVIPLGESVQTDRETSYVKNMTAVGLWELLSRVRARAKVDVWFAAVCSSPRVPSMFENFLAREGLANFACHYAMEALLSRGYRVRDQLTALFEKRIRYCCSQNPAATDYALSQVVNAIDEHRHITLLKAFEHLYKAAIFDNALDLQLSEVPKNCARVRKIVITPTRILLKAPEVMMMNRVLRDFGEDYTLRVLLRDDSMSKVFPSAGDEILDKMTGFLETGLVVGLRHYRFLAWSNSQLRDHGCYMLAPIPVGTLDEHVRRATISGGEFVCAEQVRRYMGDFSKIKNVPKYMARMGQCFTQSLPSAYVRPDRIQTDDDIEGGAFDPGTGNTERFVFSDGIGRISASAANRITAVEKLAMTPAAFQIRYCGYKGMLSVDSRLDECESNELIVFRKSMLKFEVPQEEMPRLELVKWSQPTPVTLNRPLVMILDQQSLAGGAEVHRRLRTRIFELLEHHLFEMADILMMERESAAALQDRTSIKIEFRQLASAGLEFTKEPFFRALLLAIHKHNIKVPLFKCKIEVPWEQGRTMFGVLDETGSLDYGQVHVKYSIDPNDVLKGAKTMEGTVMVTKNPCIVPGDVRLLTAVKVDALTHMVDVIVFPAKGPRPHTDEMAGSDLDGDEYAVFWDERLFFPKNAEPMTYPKAKPQDLGRPVEVRDMIAFFKTYVRLDQIGQIANAHIVAADRLGIENELCYDIAVKCSLAVDFPKTGVPPEPLTDDERPQKFPDFLGKGNQKCYRSKRLLGAIYRKVRKIEEIIAIGQCGAPREVDDDLVFDGWHHHKEWAKELRDVYNNRIQDLLDSYGIQDEAQLISGHMIYVRNRLNDGEKEDFSFFNTELIVKQRVEKLWRQFRARFFDLDERDLDEKYDFSDEQRHGAVTNDMKEKASAWYLVTYDPEYGNTRFLLSFPWIVWDILRTVKLHKAFSKPDSLSRTNIGVDPIVRRLHDEILRVTRESEFAKAVADLSEACAPNECPDIAVYVERERLLRPYLLVLLKWANAEGLTMTTRGFAWQPVHICLLFIEHLTKRARRPVNLEVPVQPEALLAEALLSFIKHVGSEEFRCLEILQLKGYVIRHAPLFAYFHSVACKTYHHIALTGRFDSLYVTEKPPTQAWDLDESDALTVDAETFGNLRYNDVCRLLVEWSGCQSVDIRRVFRQSCAITAIGKLEQRQLLRRLLLQENIVQNLQERQPPRFLDYD